VSGILTTFILLKVLVSFSSLFRYLPNQKSKMAAPNIPIVKSILSMSGWVFIEPAEKDFGEVMIVPTSDELFEKVPPRWLKAVKPSVQLLIKVITWI